MWSEYALPTPPQSQKAWPPTSSTSSFPAWEVQTPVNALRIQHREEQSMPKAPRSSLPPQSSRRNSASHPQSKAWSQEQDEKLIAARERGMKWHVIAPLHFLGTKTANACRKRHERLVEQRKAAEWDGPNLDLLATEYNAMREQIWKPLADKLGEKWRLVEAKCMEHGYRELATIARNAGIEARSRQDVPLPSIEESIPEVSSSSWGANQRRHTFGVAEHGPAESEPPTQYSLQQSSYYPNPQYASGYLPQSRHFAPLYPLPSRLTGYPTYQPVQSQQAQPSRTSIASLLDPATTSSG